MGTNKYVEKVRNRKEQLGVRRKSKYDESSKDLKTFDPGTAILELNSEYKKWEDKAKIVSKVRKRTYNIEFEDGNISHRNNQKIIIRAENPNQMSNLEENNIVSLKNGVDEDGMLSVVSYMLQEPVGYIKCVKEKKDVLIKHIIFKLLYH